jgi:hypothetical protein
MPDLPNRTDGEKKDNGEKRRARKRSKASAKSLPPLGWLRIAAAVSILALGLWVALKPDIAYAPTSRVVLFFLLTFLPAILFAGELNANFHLNLGQFVASGTGAFAAMMIVLFTLDWLAKEDRQLGVFSIERENGTSLPVDGAGVLATEKDGLGRQPSVFAEGNQVLILFDKDAPHATLVYHAPDGTELRAPVQYSGSHVIPRLRIGREFR